MGTTAFTIDIPEGSDSYVHLIEGNLMEIDGVRKVLTSLLPGRTDNFFVVEAQTEKMEAIRKEIAELSLNMYRERELKKAA